MASRVETSPDVYIVGPRWPQHARRSGYDGFHSHVGTYLRPPVASRWPWANNAMQRVVPRPRYLLTELLSSLLTRVSGRTYSLPIMRIELAAARHMLRRRNAVYHVLYGETDFWFLGLIARLTGNHLVVSFHDGERVLEGHGIDAPLLGQVSAVVVLGETQRPFFERFLPRERIAVIPHGVDPAFFHPDPSVPKQRMVITVGGHTRDYETFTEAIRLVWERDPSVRFVAVGTDIGHLGAPFRVPGVEYLSGISDEELVRHYQEASVAAFSFEWAIANNAVLEAMACGLPIVATDIGGVAEYVTPESGILFPPRDARAMADAMWRLLEDPATAATFGAAARARASALDYAVVSDQLRAVYRCLARRTALPAAPAPSPIGSPSATQARTTVKVR